MGQGRTEFTKEREGLEGFTKGETCNFVRVGIILNRTTGEKGCIVVLEAPKYKLLIQF